MSRANGLGQLGVETVRPGSIEPSLDDQLEPPVACLASNLHLMPCHLVGFAAGLGAACFS